MLYGSTVEQNQTHKPVKILINSGHKVNQFMNVLALIPGDVLMSSGEKVINARSIMSIFTLDIMKPVDIYLDDTKYTKLLECFYKKEY